MARKKLNDDLTLETLIPRYAENKQTFNDYKKICDKDNAQIKELMNKDESLLDPDGKRIKTVGNYTATLSIRDNETLNEDKLLELLKKKANKDIQKMLIKTKEYIDSDVLEKLIYNEGIPKDLLLEMDTCRESNPVEVLKVTKKKEDK